MDSDYPASHSMDTCFFAVDRDGHVAVFDSGEAGAVPKQAFAGEDAEDAREALALLPVSGAGLHDPRGYMGPRATPTHWLVGASASNILMFLSSVAPVRDEIAAGRAVELQAAGGAAVRFGKLPGELSRRLHAAGLCLGCHYHSEGLEGLGARGLFSYQHLTENWISGPYGRVIQPAQPLRADDLPQQFRDAVKALRFDVSFVDTAHVQPVEHAACDSWEPAWVDVGFRRIRPIPGCEANYAQLYSHLVETAGGTDDDPGFDVEPPQ